MRESPVEMNFAGLQARIVPLFSELLATLASQNPLRMYFADIADKTLLDIIDVLRDDGISQEAIAASLDLTMNGYRAKVKRLRELYGSGTEAGEGDEPRTLLERVYAFVGDAANDRAVKLGEIRRHFRGVKGDSLGGVLHFLVRSGLLRVTGRGENKVYRVVQRIPTDDAGIHDAKILLYREGPLTLGQVAQRLAIGEERAAELLDQIHFDGSLRTNDEGEESTFRVVDYHVPLDTVEGYEAAIFDHLSAVISGICKKVRLGRHAASLADKNGGATFTFFVPTDDPLWDEVSTFLADHRVKLEAWLERARKLSEAGLEGRPTKRVTLYVGQLVEEMAVD